MQWKKIGTVCAITAVVIGCIFAAGCTTTPSEDNTDPILGTWGTPFTESSIGFIYTTFLDDGTGKEVMMFMNDEAANYSFTWKKTGEETYQLAYSDGSIWEVTIEDDEHPLVWNPVSVNESVVGTWPSSDTLNGEKISYVTTFNPDYTGSRIGTFPDSPEKEKVTESFTWGKTGRNTYTMTFDSTSEKWIAVYDSDTKSVSFKKIDYSSEPIINAYSEEFPEYGAGMTKTIFYPNATGYEVQATENGDVGYGFVWKKDDTNSYTVSYPSVPFWEVWKVTYDPQTELIDWNLVTYIWSDNYRENGRHVLDLHYSDEKTGTSYIFDAEGNMKKYQTTWEKRGENTFRITYDDGDEWDVTYVPSTQKYVWEHAVD